MAKLNDTITLLVWRNEERSANGTQSSLDEDGCWSFTAEWPDVYAVYSDDPDINF